MNYFPATIGSEKVTIDGVKVKDKLELISQNVKNLILNNDSRCYFSSQVVVYNDELYVLNQYGLYKSKNGAKWGKILEIADLPSQNGWEAVVLNDEIHFLKRRYHYKWDGNTLTSVSTLPYIFIGSAVVLNDEIHILGGASGTTRHYKWDGTTWTSVSTLPYNFTGSAVVLNDEIHIMGGYYNDSRYSRHYKWDGTTWTQLTSLPYADTVLAVVLNDEIHIMGGSKGSSGGLGNSGWHYKYGSGSWTRLDDIVFSIVSSSNIYTVGVDEGSAFVYNDGIYVAGGGTSSGISDFNYLCRIINAKIYRQ